MSTLNIENTELKQNNHWKSGMEERFKKLILNFQKIEITEYKIYKSLSRRVKGENRRILEKISEDELRHYSQWKKYTGKEVFPDKKKVFLYLIIAKIFGLTFAIKILEKGEEMAEKSYSSVLEHFPEAKRIMEEEFEHEKLLINMIDEEKIGYIGSMVLGLNDALVELTGALAGLTLALQNTRLIGVSGFIMGLAASLSMSASEYLSQKSEGGDKNPLKASFYTGIAYILTVLLLVGPYFIFTYYYMALGITLFNALLIIYIFTFFVSVVKNLSFRRLFFEMVVISSGVALVSFIIGIFVRKFINVEIL
jgi:VIT1/CCC1 family predicted Fe2+/Mn2+ transporter